MTVSPLPFPAAEAPRREGLVVFVRGLKLEAGIGVHDHELGRLQTLIIDVTLDLAPAPVERLGDTVNYETVARAARAIVVEGHVGLVETFAERLALACLEDHRVQRCAVRIEKPGALDGAAAAGCEVVLSR
ncbi:MAG: dihydroneopterin aldolase [Brevundimonas sp.]|uniref:dihydroneopterin aldolase n=1 Tax=Brevundimonas sp. TaxID=1871086 RepID=UPI00272446D3|nr:dihydroneopterin aldolase [Brevundimonas sp.]MDO9588673.1 dihydroneopterin aldolase [Brevundimonas sp.]MDZ4109627.1 dihydroneopterin aldolase [Brevundimonas sp.]